MKYPSEIRKEIETKLEQYRQNAMKEALPENKSVGDSETLTETILGIAGAMTGFLVDAFLLSHYTPALMLLTIPLGAGLGLAIAALWNISVHKDMSKRVDVADTAYRQYEQSMVNYFQDYCKQFWQASTIEQTRVHNNIQAQKKMGGGTQHPLAYLAEALANSAELTIARIPITTTETRLTIYMLLSCDERSLRFDSTRFDYRSNNIVPIVNGNGEKVAGFAAALAQEICAADPYLRVNEIKEVEQQIIVKFKYDKPNPNYIRPVGI